MTANHMMSTQCVWLGQLTKLNNFPNSETLGSVQWRSMVVHTCSGSSARARASNRHASPG
jgi:hypothetical protein